MYNKRSYVVKNIKIYSTVKKYLTFLCFALIFACGSSFVFFGFYSSSGAIKFIAKYKDKNNIKIQKVMVNPHIKFEHTKDDYYDVKAKKAIHKNVNDFLLFDVVADGKAISIKAGELLVTNNGNNLTFSENPVLIIRKTSNDN
jgi:hypothetical protein